MAAEKRDFFNHLDLNLVRSDMAGRIVIPSFSLTAVDD